MPRKLPDYLRSERRRAGLSQEDIASLVGSAVLAVSRYERRRALPPLKIALAYEAIFGVAVADLFHGVAREVRQHVRKRALLRHDDLGRVRNARHIARRKWSLELIASE
jgi:transcriptional regulator with XRE-family HTH domain